MSDYDAFIGRVIDQIITPLVTLLAVIAFAVFVWGVVQMIASAGDEEKRSTGQQHMLWGIIGLVILFGASGIVAFLGATVGSGGSAARSTERTSFPEPAPSSVSAPRTQESPSFFSLPTWDLFQPSGGGGYSSSYVNVSTGASKPQKAATPEVPTNHAVLFAGQSNALGFGNNGAAPYAATTRVQILADTDGDGMGDTFSPMHPGVNTGTPANPRAWGPEVQFASEWLGSHPAGTLSIGKVAKGSTPLVATDGLDWSPGSTGELFDQAAEVSGRMRAALGITALDAVFWMQGEQDATSESWASAYAPHLRDFLTAARSEWMGSSQGFIAAGQVSGPGTLVYGDAVRAAQAQVDDADAHFESFSTSGFALQTDGLHYAPEGHLELGRAFYNAWAY